MKIKFIHRTYCDNCGKINPPTKKENNHITTCCGGNGKICIEYFHIRWPFIWR